MSNGHEPTVDSGRRSKKRSLVPLVTGLLAQFCQKKADHVCIGIWGRTNMYFAPAYILVGQAVTAVVGNTLGGLFPYFFKQSMPSGRLLLSDCGWQMESGVSKNLSLGSHALCTTGQTVIHNALYYFILYIIHNNYAKLLWRVSGVRFRKGGVYNPSSASQQPKCRTN